MFTPRYGLSPYIKQIPLVLKEFIVPNCSESMYSFIKPFKFAMGNIDYTKSRGTPLSSNIGTRSTLCRRTYEMLGNVVQQTKGTHAVSLLIIILFFTG